MTAAAYVAGWLAGAASLAWAAPPHRDGSAEWREWVRGFGAGRASRLAAGWRSGQVAR